MQLSVGNADIFGVCTIVVLAAALCFNVVCGVYLLYLRWLARRRRYLVLNNFNVPFSLRVGLVCFSVLWGVLEFLRLPYLRRNRLLSSLSYNGQGIVCQIYLVSSLGFATPCFFLTALLLLQGSLQTLPTSSAKRREKKGVKYIQVLLNILPFFVLQLLLVVLIEGDNREGTNGSRIMLPGVPLLLTQAYQQDPFSKSKAACTYPLLSTTVLTAFAGLFCTFFAYSCWQILPIIINKHLSRRVLVLLISFVTLLPLYIVFLGISLIWQPGDLLFELSVLWAFLAMTVCTAVGQGILVLWPVHDALDSRVLMAMEEKGTNMKDVSDIGGSSNMNPALLFSSSALGHISSEEESLDGKDDQKTPEHSIHSDEILKELSFNIGVLAHNLPK